MAKKGGNEGWLILGGVLAFGALLYLQSGRGKINSPFIPDRVEDAIDAVVEAFNQRFGPSWVNSGLDAVQSYIQKAMPQVAALANLVLWAERRYGHLPNSGTTKKFAVMQRVRFGTA
jgi:hypothetical protein